LKRRPDMRDPNQLVSFGTSGTPERSRSRRTFTEAHILALIHPSHFAICSFTAQMALSIWKDTALFAWSVPDPTKHSGFLAANRSSRRLFRQIGGVPLLRVYRGQSWLYNAAEDPSRRVSWLRLAQPPEDGGFKYTFKRWLLEDTQSHTGSRPPRLRTSCSGRQCGLLGKAVGITDRPSASTKHRRT